MRLFSVKIEHRDPQDSVPSSILPGFFSLEVFLLDDDIRDLLAGILNVRLYCLAWTQASLPVRWGGVGVRSASVLATYPFLASSHASTPLVAQILPFHLR